VERRVEHGASVAGDDVLARFDPVEAATPGAARQAVTAFARRHVRDERTLAAISLCVSEAVSNVVVHAYRGGTPGPAIVSGWIDDGAVWIGVRDHGLGLLPRLDSPGLGMGLALITQTADAAAVRTPADGGTEVRMRFNMCVRACVRAGRHTSMPTRNERIAEIEVLFRAGNDRMIDWEENQARVRRGEAPAFLCECGRRSCREHLRLTREQYEEVRTDATRFLVAPGHELLEAEDLVERRDGYVVVRKHEDVRDLVERLNLRADQRAS